MTDHLAEAYPLIGDRLPRLELAELPTPVDSGTITMGDITYPVSVKRDDLTGRLYGGNKVRKLEYLLHAARRHNAERIATYGTVASNHALATSLYARSLGLPCTCLLSNQVKTPAAARALNLHLENQTEIIRYGGNRETRIATLRKHLWHRNVFLIPPGGSNWIGAVGFVNAGLEFADQLETHVIEVPDRIYVATGTMSTAVGIILGLALAGLDTEVQAVQVTEDFVSTPAAMQRMLEKTATLLNRIEPSFPADLWRRARYQFRTGYRAGGYAKTDEKTDRAIVVAREQLGLHLEPTYTGKAMAALLDDLDTRGGNVLFWNTYNSRPLHATTARPEDTGGLPDEFLRYFD